VKISIDNKNVRVSGASLCSICKAGRYLLGINKNRKNTGLRVLAPIGGAIDLYAIDPLLQKWGATLENPSKKELRLYMPQSQLKSFEDWFKLRCKDERETSPERELTEELITEYKVITSLNRIYYRFKGFVIPPLQLSTRKTANIAMTAYFWEIYFITLSDSSLEKINVQNELNRKLRPDLPYLQWVSTDEIMNEKAVTGENIACNSKALLGPFMQGRAIASGKQVD
jgi:hypothetical protein